MPATPKALKVYYGASTRRCSKKVFYPKCATGNTTKSPVSAASGKKPLRNVKVPVHLEAVAAAGHNVIRGREWKLNPDSPH